MHGFIPSTKNDARQSVKLLEAHGGRRVERHEAHDGRLDVGRRAEVVLAHAHHMVDLCVQLHVGGQAGPERGTGLRDQSHRELALEHQYGHSEERSMRQQAEDERGGYLVGRVGDADVKVGQLCFYKVAYDDLESTLLGPRGKGQFYYYLLSLRGDRGRMVDVLALHALCELGRHARVHFHRRAVLCLLQYSHSQVSCTRPNFKDFIRRAEIGLYGQISSSSE